MKSGLYVLTGCTTVSSVCSVVHETCKTNPWHKRLGHVSQKSLTKLAKQDLLCDNNKLEFYELCVLGRANKVT